MLLARRIFAITEWTRLSDKPEEVNPNEVILKEFLDPRLSVYAVKDQDQALLLSAALCFINSAGAARCLLAYVDDSIIKAAQIKINKSKGETKVDQFDSGHYELDINDLKKLGAIISIFISNGNIYDFDEKSVRHALNRLFETKSYNIQEIAIAEGGQTGSSAWSTKGFIVQYNKCCKFLRGVIILVPALSKALCSSTVASTFSMTSVAGPLGFG